MPIRILILLSCLPVFLLARDVLVLNPGFEIPEPPKVPGTDPIHWEPAMGAPKGYDWGTISNGDTAAEGTMAILAGGTFAARTQLLEEVLAPDMHYTVSAAFNQRKFAQSRWGGYWLRIDAVQLNTGTVKVLANTFGTDPIQGWTRKQLELRTPSDLSQLGVVENGISGTTAEHDGTDFSVGTWKLRILIGMSLQNSREATVQAGIDDVRMKVVPVEASQE